MLVLTGENPINSSTVTGGMNITKCVVALDSDTFIFCKFDKLIILLVL